jgi:Secretion system C-terminal sorting domain
LCSIKPRIFSPMRLLTSFLFLSSINNFTLAQSNYVIEGKDYTASLWNSDDYFFGILGPNPGHGYLGFEVPKGKNSTSIFTSQIWIGGISQSTGNLHVSSAKWGYWNYGAHGWFSGPLANTFSNQYDSVFHATKQEVQYHFQNYLNPGYSIPNNFLSWPGNGNVQNGEPQIIAPFFDSNQNGIYDPIMGDAPFVAGNSSAFLILNDTEDTTQGNLPIGSDLRIFYYDMSFDDPLFVRTPLVNIRLTNRSNNIYEDVFVSLFMDFDLGDPFDDLIGSDSSQNFFYAYNRDNLDSFQTLSGYVIGYGRNPPAQAVLILNQQMSSLVAYKNNNDPKSGEPINQTNFYSYMKGVWKDGSSIRANGEGTDTIGLTTKFMFHGNGWNDPGSNDPGSSIGERHSVGSIGPFTFLPGEEICLDIAFPFFWDSTVNHLANRDSLLPLVQKIQAYYDNNNMGCGQPLVVGLPEKINSTASVSLYPNPVLESLHFKIGNYGNEMEFDIVLFDLQGKPILKLFESKYEGIINLNELRPGIYFLRIQSGSDVFTERIVKR